MRQHSAMIQAWVDMKNGKREARMAPKMALPTYGPKPPPALSVDERKMAVERTSKVLNNWTASPFEHEGACRQGLRSQLCMAGVAWPRADLEAAVVVEKALSQNGARRPTWEQGQPELTGVYDNCVHCNATLSDEQVAHHDRFCSVECVRSHRQTSAVRDGERYVDVTRAAQRVVTLSKRPVQTCEHCSKKFKKRGHQKDGRFCSANCAKQAIRTIPDLVCENPACGKTYKTHSAFMESKHHYCSSACAHADRERWAPVYKGECLLCGKAFEKKAKAKFCSSNCALRHNQYATGRVVPKRVSPVIFDFFITLPAQEARPKWLSAKRFDAMLAA